jgi:hypothetical protein
MREAARLRKAEKFQIHVLREFEEREGVPIVLLDPYADAVDRYDPNGWRKSDNLATGGEVIAEARVHQGQVSRSRLCAIPSLNGEGRIRVRDGLVWTVDVCGVLKMPGWCFREFAEPLGESKRS